MNKALSPTVLVIGPATLPKNGGFIATRPLLGFNETVAVHAAGKRSEPPISVPTCNGPYQAAADAAAPALEPPGFHSGFHGLLVNL